MLNRVVMKHDCKYFNTFSVDNEWPWQWKSFIAKVEQGETCDQYNTYRIVCLKGEQDK